jgi:hypothetical protein
MTQVVTRIPAYSNDSMLHYCETLLSILSKSHNTKVGRGKKAELTKVFKHKQDPDVIDRLINSIEHYKKLNQMKNRKVGSFEIIKYKIVIQSGNPKIEIEMIKVLDEDGEYIKFARLKDVIGYLSKYPVTFRPI